jgi:hypothetical protein
MNCTVLTVRVVRCASAGVHFMLIGRRIGEIEAKVSQGSFIYGVSRNRNADNPHQLLPFHHLFFFNFFFNKAVSLMLEPPSTVKISPLV